MAPEIRIDSLTFQYTPLDKPALDLVMFAADAGSCCAILGPTGSGKSTLLLALSGALAVHHKHSLSSGNIRIGNDLFAPLPTKVLFPTVALCMQESYVQISGFRETVYDELLMTLECLGGPNHNADHRIRNTLRTLGILHLIDRNPHQLSEGESHKVVLGSMLVANPSVLLLDEPTNALDETAQRKLAAIICGIRSSATVLLSENNLSFALSVADTLMVLDSGSVVFRGTRKEFLEQIESFASILPVEQWSTTVRLTRQYSGKQSQAAGKIKRFLGIS